MRGVLAALVRLVPTLNRTHGLMLGAVTVGTTLPAQTRCQPSVNSIPKVQFAVPPVPANKDIVQACQILEGWEQVQESELDITKMTGGITNTLFKVVRRATNETVLVRIYGPNTELFINRDTENAILAQLSELRFGPALLGLFDNGRVESWLEAVNIEPKQMSDPVIVRKVAARLAQFHQLPIQLDKEPNLWAKLDNFFELALACDFSDNPEKAQKYRALDLRGAVARDLQALKKLLSKTPSPVVFAHNDALAGNILLTQTGQIEFVDLEYGGYNFRGFDIGNHFCEFAGFDYTKIDDVYPNKAAQYAFFESYLQEDSTRVGGHVRNDELDRMYVEVNRYGLAAHFFWGLWAVVQAKHSPIEFDYLEYSRQRLSAFSKYYKEFEDL